MFPLTQDEVETRYRAHNYILITQFTGSKSKVTAICPEGHEWEHLHSNFKKGIRCSECSGKRKYLLDEAKQFFVNKNFTPTFTVYNNSKQMLSYVCNEHPEYGEQHCSLSNLIQECANCQVCYRNKSRGENNPSWKGGNTGVPMLMRDFIYNKWTLPSLAKHNYVCFLSNQKEDLQVHHAEKSFHIIIECALESLGISSKKKLNEFSLSEMEEFKQAVLNLHYETGYGIPLTKKIHKLFHSIYGIKDNNINQFNEFKEDYESGKFDSLLIKQKGDSK